MEREDKWMATRRNALGRGLGALIPAPSAATGALRADSGAVPEPRGPYTQIPVERIRPNPQQPRRDFGADELAGLADSIIKRETSKSLIQLANMVAYYFDLIENLQVNRTMQF